MYLTNTYHASIASRTSWDQKIYNKITTINLAYKRNKTAINHVNSYVRQMYLHDTP